jgi:HSP20 family protein
MTGEKRLMVLVTVLGVVGIGAVVYQSLHIARLQEAVNALQGPAITIPSTKGSVGQAQAQSPPANPTLKPGPSSAPLTEDDWDPFGLASDDWNPFAEMQQMQARMDRMFDGAFHRFSNSPGFAPLAGDPLFSPDIDLKEEGEHYVVRVDVPGTDRGNLDVRVEDRELVISGDREEVLEEKEEDRFVRKERRSGHFERSITLPGPVKEEAVKADYKEGVLTITLPKKEEPGGSVKVPIEITPADPAP